MQVTILSQSLVLIRNQEAAGSCFGPDIQRNSIYTVKSNVTSHLSQTISQSDSFNRLVVSCGEDVGPQ